MVVSGLTLYDQSFLVQEKLLGAEVRFRRRQRFSGEIWWVR